MRLTIHLDHLVESERALADSFQVVSAGHAGDAEVHALTGTFATECQEQLNRLGDLAVDFGTPRISDPERIPVTSLAQARTGPHGLFRDLLDIYAIAGNVLITCEVLHQAGMALRDSAMLAVVDQCHERTRDQMEWLHTTLKEEAPQVLVAG